MCTREELLLLRSFFMRGGLSKSSFKSLLLSNIRLERDADDHWHDLSKAIAYFAKDVSQEVI